LPLTVVLCTSLFYSCSKEEDLNDCVDADNVNYVDSIVGNSLGKIDVEINFDVYYNIIGDCEVFQGYTEEDSSLQRTISIKTNSNNCPSCSQKTIQTMAQYKYTSSIAGLHILRFAHKKNGYIYKKIIIQ